MEFAAGCLSHMAASLLAAGPDRVIKHAAAMDTLSINDCAISPREKVQSVRLSPHFYPSAFGSPLLQGATRLRAYPTRSAYVLSRLTERHLRHFAAQQSAGRAAAPHFYPSASLAPSPRGNAFDGLSHSVPLVFFHARHKSTCAISPRSKVQGVRLRRTSIPPPLARPFSKGQRVLGIIQQGAAYVLSRLTERLCAISLRSKVQIDFSLRSK